MRAHNQLLKQGQKPLRVFCRLAWRVCQAWHLTREVKVLLPGIRRAEG